MNKAIIRPLRKADVVELRGRSYGCTLRGLAVELDGEVIGFAAVAITAPVQLVSVITDKLRGLPVTLVRATRQMAEILRDYPAPVYAFADPDVEGSERFLNFIGFEALPPSNDNVPRYVWINREA